MNVAPEAGLPGDRAPGGADGPPDAAAGEHAFDEGLYLFARNLHYVYAEPRAAHSRAHATFDPGALDRCRTLTQLVALTGSSSISECHTGVAGGITIGRQHGLLRDREDGRR